MVDNIEDVDTVVGWLAETTRPHGFAISETQFQVFILNASRRLFSDRFFTSSFRPEFYTTLGVEWVTNNGPGRQIREGPAERSRGRGLAAQARAAADDARAAARAGSAWSTRSTRGRATAASTTRSKWKPRPGAESDPAFRQSK